MVKTSLGGVLEFCGETQSRTSTQANNGAAILGASRETTDGFALAESDFQNYGFERDSS
jgi:hypothetical protein